MGKDYYSILGVSKTADDAELKKGVPVVFEQLVMHHVYAHSICNCS